MIETTQLQIRDAVSDDQAFLIDCALAMALETEHKRLDPARLQHGVGTLLAQPARGFYLIAERAGTPTSKAIAVRLTASAAGTVAS